jgi:hypothetical protein
MDYLCCFQHKYSRFGMTQDIPEIPFHAQSMLYSAATGVPGRHLVLSFGPHGIATLGPVAQQFTYPLYQPQTDSPREACRAQTATAMCLACTRSFPVTHHHPCTAACLHPLHRGLNARAASRRPPGLIYTGGIGRITLELVQPVVDIMFRASTDQYRICFYHQENPASKSLVHHRQAGQNFTQPSVAALILHLYLETLKWPYLWPFGLAHREIHRPQVPVAHLNGRLG